MNDTDSNEIRTSNRRRVLLDRITTIDRILAQSLMPNEDMDAIIYELDTLRREIQTFVV